MLGALSLLANSGADSRNTDKALHIVQGTCLQGPNMPFWNQSTLTRALAQQQQIMGFCGWMLFMGVKSWMHEDSHLQTKTLLYAQDDV